MQIFFAITGYLLIGASAIVFGLTLWAAYELGLHWLLLVGLFATYLLYGNGDQMLGWSRGEDDF